MHFYERRSHQKAVASCSYFGGLRECGPNLPSCAAIYRDNHVLSRDESRVLPSCLVNPRFLSNVTQHNMGPRQPKSHRPPSFHCACAQINKLSNRESTCPNHFNHAVALTTGSLGWNRKRGWLAILDNMASPSIRSSILAKFPGSYKAP